MLNRCVWFCLDVPIVWNFFGDAHDRRRSFNHVFFLFFLGLDGFSYFKVLIGDKLLRYISLKPTAQIFFILLPNQFSLSDQYIFQTF